MSTVAKRNIIIIGGGPAGLSAALYNARAGLAPLVFAGSPPGGQLMLTSEVENFPGSHSVLGPDLIQRLREQANAFGAEIIDENITSVDFKGEHKTVTTSRGSWEGKVVILATGAQALWLGLPSEARLRGRGVSACATCDGFFFKGKDVAVVGGGDTALEEAHTLTRFAKKVYIIHRRDAFRASKIMQDRVLHDKHIEVIWNASVQEVLGDTQVAGVRLQTDAGQKEVAVQGLFVAIGHKPDTGLFGEQVLLDEKGYVVTSAMHALALASHPEKKSVAHFDYSYQTMTSVHGVFAGGDCVDYTYRQASTAAGMGVAASLDAERWISQNTP